MAIVLVASLVVSVPKPTIVSPDKFVVSYWYGVPPEQTNQQRYAEIAEAGFNLVTPNNTELSVDQARAHNRKVLDLCKANGLKAIIYDPRVAEAKPGSPSFERDMDEVIHDYARHPALYGYYLRDEPGNADFPWLAAVSSALIKRDPKHLPYINLVPVVAGGMFGGPPFRNDPAAYPPIRDAYVKHLDGYIKTVNPKLVCYDEYDLFEGGGIRGWYFANLELIRNAAQKQHLPFWNIFLVTPHVHGHGTYRDPSLSDLRFLVYTTLAYGARGLMYFTYWTPPEGFGNAIIDAKGNRTRHYEEVKQLNFQIHRLASTLSRLHSDGVYHVGKQPMECHALPPGTLLARVDGPDVLVSFLSDSRGRRYVMVVNKDMVQDQTISLEFTEKVALKELSAEDGRWRRISGLRRFDGRYLSGQGRLFEVLPPK
jgi:hypothetical protein